MHPAALLIVLTVFLLYCILTHKDQLVTANSFTCNYNIISLISYCLHIDMITKHHCYVIERFICQY